MRLLSSFLLERAPMVLQVARELLGAGNGLLTVLPGHDIAEGEKLLKLLQWLFEARELLNAENGLRFVTAIAKTIPTA